MYAILKTGGKQYKVSEGDVIYVEKLGVEDGATVTFDEVLAVGEGDKLTVGAPYVSGAAVTGTVEKTGKGKKINIFKMKPKKGYRRRQGHRQPYTKVTIASIKGTGSSRWTSSATQAMRRKGRTSFVRRSPVR